MSKAQQDIRRKTRVLEHAARTGNVRQTCRYFGIPRSLFYVWKAAYEREGAAGLVNKKPCAHTHPKATAAPIIDHILHLRRTYHLGPIRIAWYLERYHGIRVCDATVYRTLTRHGLNRLPTRVGRRAVHTHRYEKQVPGHHVQVDLVCGSPACRGTRSLGRRDGSGAPQANPHAAASRLLKPLGFARTIRIRW